MTLSEVTRQRSRFRKLSDNTRRWTKASSDRPSSFDTSSFDTSSFDTSAFGFHWLKIASEAEMLDHSLLRLRRVEAVIDAQKAYIDRAADPDTRYRAEGNLIKLVIARNDLREYVLSLRSRGLSRH